MMGVPFVKMHGIGNDFIVIDGFKYAVENPAGFARNACRRRVSVGADGVIFVMPSRAADVRMWIFNADGSEAEMCGNGIRCAAKFAHDQGICTKPEIDVETLAGVKHIVQQIEGGVCTGSTVDMGAPDFDPAHIPVAADTNRVRIDLDGKMCEFFCASTGVPHAVTFDLFPDEADFLRLGAMLEAHPLFPRKANIEFCRVIDRENVQVLVWERGCGPTLACGTGSCAVLAAGVTMQLIDRSAAIHLPGGTLHDHWAEDGHLAMRGPAAAVANGQFLD